MTSEQDDVWILYRVGWKLQGEYENGMKTMERSKLSIVLHTRLCTRL